MTGSMRGVYLRPLPGEPLPARYSAGSRRRAGQLRGFLAALQAVLPPPLAAGPAELLVVDRADWRQLSSADYGPPLVRGAPGRLQVVAAADYPPRLLARLGDALLRAAQAGAPPPGEAREWLDLLLGRVWGQAVVAPAGGRLRPRWREELLGSAVFARALAESGADGTLGRWRAWSATGAALGWERPAGGRLRPAELLAYQGALSRLAAPAEGRIWELARCVAGGASWEEVVALEPSLARAEEVLGGPGVRDSLA